MTSGTMHADELEIDGSLVSGLIADQFPEWAELPITRVASAGTDNALFRLGEQMVVRMPRIHWAVGQVEKEQKWLPRIAPLLPLEVPIPLAKGAPGKGYPWSWSVYRWLEGENATPENISDPHRAALDLAGFIAALHRIDATDGPPPGEHNSSRGEPLLMRNDRVREAIGAARDVVDANAAASNWDDALDAPEWPGPPVWIHGDLQEGNLLAVKGRLSAVIDFGCLGVGDPACDVMTAWLYLSPAARDGFRAALEVDDATWRRARGWALSIGLIALPYYRDANPALARIARRAIREVLDDFEA